MAAVRVPRTARATLAVLACSGLLLTACGSATDAGGPSGAASGTAPTGSTSVVAAFYPLAFAAEAVAGDGVTVTSLTPPGVEPHDLELSAQQVADIASADLVLYVPGFQPAVDEAIAQQAADRALDVTAGLTLLAGADHADEHAGSDHSDEHAAEGASDPHVWLDPANMAAIGSAIADRLGTTDGAGAQQFAADMATLDEEYRTALGTCASRDLVVSHEAFGYLADAYGFTQVGISGLSPEAEPSPARMKEVADLVRANGITTIYYETLVDPKVAQTVADETGAATAVLDPLEGLAEGADGDYVSIMRENLATLVAGQDCT